MPRLVSVSHVRKKHFFASVKKKYLCSLKNWFLDNCFLKNYSSTTSSNLCFRYDSLCESIWFYSKQTGSNKLIPEKTNDMRRSKCFAITIAIIVIVIWKFFRPFVFFDYFEEPEDYLDIHYKKSTYTYFSMKWLHRSAR